MTLATAERTGVRLSDEQRLQWLRLIRSDGVGPVTFRELINHFGSAAAALDAMPALAERGGRKIRIASRSAAEREAEATVAMGGTLVALGEPDYPAWLRAAADAPPILAIRGSRACLARPAIAIVGSRNASITGRKIAFALARDLAAEGFAIASGLAVGIDTAAHEGSAGTGTIAVFAGGLDQLYPPENTALAERILAAGVHVSEMPLGAEPRARDFPRRNRIVSGLAVGVVVVEAAERSGSLVTAARAADQGRLLFAVPGSPLDPRAAGTNRLIKDGAILTTSATDVLAEVRPMLDRPPAPPGSPQFGEPERSGGAAEADDSDRACVVNALGKAPVTIDEIVRFTGLRPPVVHLILLEMDLAGRIERHPGQGVSLA